MGWGERAQGKAVGVQWGAQMGRPQRDERAQAEKRWQGRGPREEEGRGDESPEERGGRRGRDGGAGAWETGEGAT